MSEPDISYGDGAPGEIVVADVAELTKPRVLHLTQDATIYSWALEQYDRIESHGYRLTVLGDIEDAAELAGETGHVE